MAMAAVAMAVLLLRARCSWATVAWMACSGDGCVVEWRCACLAPALSTCMKPACCVTGGSCACDNRCLAGCQQPACPAQQLCSPHCCATTVDCISVNTRCASPPRWSSQALCALGLPQRGQSSPSRRCARRFLSTASSVRSSRALATCLRTCWRWRRCTRRAPTSSVRPRCWRGGCCGPPTGSGRAPSAPASG